MAVVLAKAVPDLSKLEHLDGTNYKRWSQKLLIFFEQLEVDYVLYVELPIETQSIGIPATLITTPLAETTKASDSDYKKKYKKDNKTIRGHLFNHMNNSLFDLFVNQKSSKVIWDILEQRYGGDDARKKKYVVGKWLQFQMVDDKPILE